MRRELILSVMDKAKKKQDNQRRKVLWKQENEPVRFTEVM